MRIDEAARKIGSLEVDRRLRDAGPSRPIPTVAWVAVGYVVGFASALVVAMAWLQ